MSEAIQDKPERILQTQDFRSSERLSDFLRFVVEETLGGRADSIKQRTVAPGSRVLISTVNWPLFGQWSQFMSQYGFLGKPRRF